MVDITILEIHLPDGQLDAFTPGGDTRGENEGTEHAAGDPAEGSSGSAIAALLVLVAFAALAWYLRRGR